MTALPTRQVGEAVRLDFALLPMVENPNPCSPLAAALPAALEQGAFQEQLRRA